MHPLARLSTFLLATTLATTVSAQTVEQAVNSGCTTQQVEGLSLQIIGQAACIAKDAYVEVPKRPNANYGNAVLPYMQEPGQVALLEALDENASLTMTINSMLRTVAQQYLLYRWYQLGKCNIALAAKPGGSNHETGLAIDISQASTWRPILEAKGFAWFGSNDPVHFDWAGPGTKDYKGVDVRAFQQLWNKNNPDDLIAEDGLYGPQTEARLKQTPAAGFATGPGDCTPPDPEPPMEGDAKLDIQLDLDANDLLTDGPSQGVLDLYVGDKTTLRLTVTNTGDAASDPQTGNLSLPEALRTDVGTDIAVDAIAPGEAKTFEVAVQAASYSLLAEAPSIVKAQLGQASAELAVDVYSQRQFEFESGRQEGFNCTVVDGSCIKEGPAESLQIESPSLDVELGPEDALALSIARLAAGAGQAELRVQGRDGEVVVPLPLGADEDYRDFVFDRSVLPDNIIGIQLRALAKDELPKGNNAPVRLELDYLRIGPDARFVPGTNSGCSCGVLGKRQRSLPSPWVVLSACAIAAAAFRRRGRAPARHQPTAHGS